MSIPLPGAGFVYSLLKDVWSWGSTWLRGRRFAPDVFRGWTVDEWYHPYVAIKEFGDRVWLRQMDVAEQRRTEAFEARAKLIEGRSEARERCQTPRELDQEYNAASNAVQSVAGLIYKDLEQQLTRGELIARGFPEPFSHGAPYLTISRHEWRVIELKLPDRAAGGGIAYVGLTIGKPGTKRLFRRDG